jgi:acyl CoA:acetate/3-ketoacid CoA transferase
MYTIPRIAKANDMYKKINFTIEQGPFGGLPEPGVLLEIQKHFLIQ